MTLAPSQSAAVTLKFAPIASGVTTGNLTITNSDGVNASGSIGGTGVQAGLSVTPSTVSFGSVVSGSTNSQTVQMKNSGTASLTISQASVTGTGFGLSGLVLPMTLAPGQSGNFNVQYAPQAASSVTGAVSILSNAPNSPTMVPLSGTGVTAASTISVNPGGLSFASITAGSTATQSLTITNTGNANVSISSVAGSAPFFIVSGAGAVTLSPNQSSSVTVQFAPTTAGSKSGSATIVSNATGSPSIVALSGTATSPTTVSHSIALNWGSSASTVSGYNVYRSSVSGSSYVRMNGSLVSGVGFSDSSVQSGQTYYYVATSVDSTGNESVYSNETSAIVP